MQNILTDFQSSMPEAFCLENKILLIALTQLSLKTWIESC